MSLLRKTPGVSRWLSTGTIVAAACLIRPNAAEPAAVCPVLQHVVTTVNGLKVDQYSWSDSQGLLRTVSLKQEGNGNSGHGGYAVQMTYQVSGAKGPTTVTVNAENSSDGGFGYFVSHERYRTFTDGAYDTIADHVFHTDDSPLGNGFPAVGTVLTLKNPVALAQQFTMTYRHYGTVTGIAKNAQGNDVSPTPVAPSALALYSMPITITWVFHAGTDYPRIDTSIDLSQIAKPDRVNFDIRGPYGVMVFDNGADGVITKAMWGDRYQFATTQVPPTLNSGWTWNQANQGARFSALIAGSYEMGLFEPAPFSKTALDDGYADERGSTSATYNHGKGCSQGATQLLPCDWEWPYQSIQYSLPASPTQPAYYKKMAWGSSAYYGTGTSLTTVWDSGTTSEPFTGFPASGKISYSLCVVLGLATTTGLTHNSAANQTGCASALVE